MAVLGRSREERKFDREQNARVRRANTSLSSQPDALFNEWKGAGWIDPKIKNWDDALDKYKQLVEGGAKPSEAAKQILPRIDESGNIFVKDYKANELKIDRRKIRTSLAPATRQIADIRGGQGAGNQFNKQVRDAFDRPGNKGGEMRAKARAAHVDSGFGKGKIQYDLGHYRAAAHPAGAGYDGPKNMDPELSWINQAHIAKDRIPEWAMQEWGIPLNGPEAVVEHQGNLPSRSGLTTRGGHIPQAILDDLSTSAYRGAFEKAREMGELDFTASGPNSGVRNMARSEAIYNNWDYGLEKGPARFGNVKSYGQALAIADKTEQLGQQGLNIRPAIDELSPLRGANSVAKSGPMRIVKGKDALVQTPEGWTRRVPLAPKATPPKAPKVPTKAFPNRLVGRAAKAANLPFAGGIIAGAVTFAGGGTPAQAAGAFIDAENPIDGGSIADGTLQANTPQAVAQRRQQAGQDRAQFAKTITKLSPAGLAQAAFDGVTNLIPPAPPQTQKAQTTSRTRNQRRGTGARRRR